MPGPSLSTGCSPPGDSNTNDTTRLYSDPTVLQPTTINKSLAFCNRPGGWSVYLMESRAKVAAPK